MIDFILNNKTKIIAIHLAFGFLGTLPFFPNLLGLVVILVPAYIIITKGNENEVAFLFAAYIAGGEVFVRMTGGFILYETGKYLVILFLSLGLLTGRFKQSFSIQYLLYLFLLLIGIIFTQVPEGESLRKNVLFNLSGPIVLGVSAFYFYQRPISLKVLQDALFFMLLPLFSMIMYLYFRTPDLREIVFQS
ncbi:MAG: O-antigen ligase domain-containing protein, partial [Polaribacter sp.]